ncbi:type VI secretion protein [Enterobacter hormaechei]|uniref:type VI secretion protein n=1 Tax=Enterobacter hormaechei TaxID=158836 RepID=UPI0013D172F8|nr:type VI secretion protein [Enterobacter hormaechei]MBG0594982.1 type VI secretion protein [Enterobacter hormaechei]MCM7322625.1 type VI secretion protein [Enterobacter hormaechei]MCM7371516.1 type VI secretion protein [Enterobacter hormaechei]
MGWVRTKALTTEHPPAPSLVWWLFAGALMAIAGVLLFLLHAFGAIKTLSEMDIWWVSLAPAGCWLLVFCLRCYLWDRELKVHQFLQKEAEYGQQQWEAWAGRYQAVLGSTVLLPDNITAAVWGKERPQQYGLTRRIDYLPAEAPAHMGVMRILLASVEDRVQRLPAELPLHVTLVTENPSPELTSSFNNLWKEHIPGRAVPDEITFTDSFSLSEVEARLKQAVLTVNLLLVIQLNGGEAYSDGLAALLLTSDDVAQKYHLPHPARLLRPMPLDMNNFEDDITLFLETQTVACRTASVIGDVKKWTEKSAALITRGSKMNAPWKAEDIALLEKWCGIPGPASPWLLTALATDLVSLRRQSLLALFSTEQEHFISTITPGSEDEYTG